MNGRKDTPQNQDLKSSGFSDSSPVGMFQVDSQGNFLAVNTALAQMLDCETPAEVLDKGLNLEQEFFSDPEGRAALLNSPTSMQPVTARRFLCYKRSGNSFQARLNAWPVTGPHGNFLYTEGILEDISLSCEEEDKEQQTRVEQATAKARNEFLARMSHEIRTPVNVILGMAENIGEGPLESWQKESLRALHASGEMLLSIVDDILDFSRIEMNSVSLHRDEFDLLDVLEEVCSLVAHKAQAKGIELVLRSHEKMPRLVTGDGPRLRQVLLNLLLNAIKFTNEGIIALEAGGAVGLTASDEHVFFSVSDSGVGIPLDKQQAIFESFNQLDTSTTRKFGGLGLGLSISKRLVDLMQGEIWFESEPGNGAIFHFSAHLPKAVDQTGNPATVEPFCKAAQGTSAVICIADERSRLHLAHLLEEAGISVHQSAQLDDCLQTLDELEQTPPTMLFADAAVSGAALIPGHCNRKTTCILIDIGSTGEGWVYGRREPFVGSLRKPVKRRHLAQALECAMAQEAGESCCTIVEERSVRVLIAEDIDANRFVLHTYLRNQNVEIADAVNGREAVEYYEQNGADLVLMDLEMPELDGIEATTLIRKLEQEQNFTPATIIAVTAHAYGMHREMCMEAGCNAFIPKPVRKERIISEVEKVRKKLSNGTPCTASSPENVGHENCGPEYGGPEYGGLEAAQSGIAQPEISKQQSSGTAAPERNSAASSPEPVDKGTESLHGAGKPDIHAIIQTAIQQEQQGQSGLDDKTPEDVAATYIVADPGAGKGCVLGTTPPALDDLNEVVTIDADLADLIPDFFEEVRTELDAMQSALGSGDMPTLQRLAHGYKGAAANYDMEGLSSLFRYVEVAAREERADDCRDVLDIVPAHLDRMKIIYVEV